VQIRIDFITDESKKFATLINDTKRFTKDIDSAQAEVAKLEKELEKLQKNGKDTTKVQTALATANQKLQTALKGVADTAHSFEKVDMSKLMPTQLIARAKQLEKVLALMPPHFRKTDAGAKALEEQLTAINKQLAANKVHWTSCA
jgi:septal ring factor EnvC (AmiA/AmiB activator)